MRNGLKLLLLLNVLDIYVLPLAVQVSRAFLLPHRVSFEALRILLRCYCFIDLFPFWPQGHVCCVYVTCEIHGIRLILIRFIQLLQRIIFLSFSLLFRSLCPLLSCTLRFTLYFWTQIDLTHRWSVLRYSLLILPVQVHQSDLLRAH